MAGVIFKTFYSPLFCLNSNYIREMKALRRNILIKNTRSNNISVLLLFKKHFNRFPFTPDNFKPLFLISTKCPDFKKKCAQRSERHVPAFSETKNFKNTFKIFWSKKWKNPDPFQIVCQSLSPCFDQAGTQFKSVSLG